MGLVWADFPSGQRGLYGTTHAYMLNGVWAEITGSGVALTSDPDPNIGSAGVVLSTTGGASVRRIARIVNPAGAQATSGVGVRLWPTHLPAGNANYGNPTIWFATAANVVIGYVKILADGSIGAYNSSDTLLGQSPPAISASSHNHIEAKMLRHASAGTIEVRVNGAPKLVLDTLALGSSNIGMVLVGSWLDSNAASPTSYWKDFIYWDGTGSQFNDFQGSVAVHDLLPDSDNSLGWEPSTGSTGFDLVDEGDSGPVDSDYISADDTPPSPTIFTMTDLPPDVTSVRALIAIGRQVKTDGGDCNTQMSLSPNGTDWDDGEDRAITIADTYSWDVSPTSPDTTAPWTPAEVDDLLFKINRTL